jgi:hypothetical protein
VGRTQRWSRIFLVEELGSLQRKHEREKLEKSYDPAPLVDKISLDCERRLQFCVGESKEQLKWRFFRKRK